MSSVRAHRGQQREIAASCMRSLLPFHTMPARAAWYAAYSVMIFGVLHHRELDDPQRDEHHQRHDQRRFHGGLTRLRA